MVQIVVIGLQNNRKINGTNIFNFYLFLQFIQEKLKNNNNHDNNNDQITLRINPY